MSIFSQVDSGTKAFHSRFHKSISYEKIFDCRFGEAVPVLEKFCLPGDVWKIGGQALVRFHPMVTPTLTTNYLKVRYFFVPLRLIEEDTELIITGSTNGHLYSDELPVFKNFVADADKEEHPNAYKLNKYGFYDYLGVPLGDYEAIKDDECLPAAYWYKAYKRIMWDYYIDENIGSAHATYDDFEAYWDSLKTNGCHSFLHAVLLPKDYFTSSLPWQLKAPGGIGPVLDVTGSVSMTPTFDFSELVANEGTIPSSFDKIAYFDTSGVGKTFDVDTDDGGKSNIISKLEDVFNDTQSATVTGLGFNADELRTMMAQTRIFERLARTGSRYTEYLRANFFTAPADGTLQRAQYLGGWKLPIVTTEVLQTAADGANPVGTMRGHGISNGGNRIHTFVCKEFGVLLGIAHVLPKISYTQGIARELTYKKRFDFFNPSLQHLSEQEVRNGELYVSFTDGLNDDTFGFQAYANELRTSVDKVVADMRDTMASWNQAINFGATRPNLNNAFISSNSYLTSFNRCFAVSGESARPVIVDFYNDLDVYRPMVRYATPGLVDHL